MAAGIRDADGELGFLSRLYGISKIGLKRQLGHDGITAELAVAINFRTQARTANGNDDTLAGLEFGNFNFAPPPGNAEIISIGERSLRAFLRFVFGVGTRAKFAPEMFFHRRRQSDG